MPEQFACPRCGKVITVAFVHPESQVICPDCRIVVNDPVAGDRPWGLPSEPVGGLAAPAPPAGGTAGMPGGSAPPPAQKTSGMAVTSMILAIGSLPLACCYGFGILTGIVALILGVVALKQIRRSRGAIRGRGMAKAGVIISSIFLVIMAVLVIICIVYGVKFGPQMMKAASHMEKMQQIGAACQSYAASNRGEFPDRLEMLVDQGYVTSVADPETGDPYVYVGKGQSVNAMSDRIIAFSESSGFMGTHGVIMSNGGATMLPRNILAQMLRSQGVPEDLIP